MKKYTSLLTLFILFACADNQNPNITILPGPSSNAIEFFQFSSVYELLISAGDFSEEECTLKILSNEGAPLHIQVSNLVNSNHTDDLIKEQVKRNIVFVAFQAFARTNIEEFTITSIPVTTEIDKPRCPYLEAFQVTNTVKRRSAIKIIDNYLGATKFQDLYQYNASIPDWLPNQNFRFLQYDILEQVYADIVK